MKQCSKCKQWKDESEFNCKDRSRGKFYAHCKECRHYWWKQHVSLKPELRERYRQNSQKRRDKLNAFFIAYLKEHPCVDCGESDLVVLEFDHVNGDKVNEISLLKRRTTSVEKILAEIEKCEVRCANCHKRRHAYEGNWFTVSMA